MLDASLDAVLAGALAVAVAACRGADTTMTVPRYRQSPKFGVVQFEQVQTKLVRLVRFVEVEVARLPHAKHGCVTQENGVPPVPVGPGLEDDGGNAAATHNLDDSDVAEAHARRLVHAAHRPPRDAALDDGGQVVRLLAIAESDDAHNVEGLTLRPHGLLRSWSGFSSASRFNFAPRRHRASWY